MKTIALEVEKEVSFMQATIDVVFMGWVRKIIESREYRCVVVVDN